MPRSNLNLLSSTCLPVTLLLFLIFIEMSIENDVPGNQNDIVKVLIKCTNFAAIKHKDQRRKDATQTPYINHPIGTSNNKMLYHKNMNVSMKKILLVGRQARIHQ